MKKLAPPAERDRDFPVHALRRLSAKQGRGNLQAFTAVRQAGSRSIFMDDLISTGKAAKKTPPAPSLH